MAVVKISFNDKITTSVVKQPITVKVTVVYDNYILKYVEFDNDTIPVVNVKSYLKRYATTFDTIMWSMIEFDTLTLARRYLLDKYGNCTIETKGVYNYYE